MGEDYQRTASAEEVAAMDALLVKEMYAGSLGLGTGLEYDPGIYASTEDDTRFARKIVITLVADCTLINTLTGKPYFSNREVSATTDTYTDSGHIQAEYQAIPVLSQRLASNISHLVLDIW